MGVRLRAPGAAPAPGADAGGGLGRTGRLPDLWLRTGAEDDLPRCAQASAGSLAYAQAVPGWERRPGGPRRAILAAGLRAEAEAERGRRGRRIAGGAQRGGPVSNDR